MSHDEMILEGLHCNVGTYMLSTNAYSIVAWELCDLVRYTKLKWSHTIKYIDLGDGFAFANTLNGSYLQGAYVIPYFDNYAEAITSTVLNFS